MRLRIFWVGKTKERYLTEGINKYLDLLRHMARVSVVEIKDERGKDRAASLSLEGKRILRQSESYMLLDEKGKEFSSRELARFLEERDSLDLVMGGPFGVSDEVKARASETIALSRLTFTHEMARLILLEQIYRAAAIIKDTGYHH
ncbi:MAG: 23S rRNA (pseudouridine(1915)-N(3))-methyltransferase RlmH [Nitrospirales bacterium]|nr:23S rRNA (pseudouridine(1915)-N(3))-methyltransferase RlmH [Nitrospirales bacterium]